MDAQSLHRLRKQWDPVNWEHTEDMCLSGCYNIPLSSAAGAFAVAIQLLIWLHMDALRKEENFLEENLKTLAEGAASFCEFNGAEPSGRKCGILLINGQNWQATFSSQWASQLH